jgi:creatinine amidohydrolase
VITAVLWSSDEHAAFAGTLSIGAPALEQVVAELVRNVDAFAGVALVCGPGANAEPLAAADAAHTREGWRVLAWSLWIQGGDMRAGRTETSMMIVLGPDSSISRVP